MFAWPKPWSRLSCSDCTVISSIASIRGETTACEFPENFIRLELLMTPSMLFPCAIDGSPSQVPVYPGTNCESAVKSRFCSGRSSICLKSTVVPIALVVVSTNGAVPPLTSTVSFVVPTTSLAEMSVVWAACTITSVNTCVWKPAFDTVSLYFPRERFTKVWVPCSWVSALRTSFVVRSRSSSCAPCTTLPLGSSTVNVTVPSEPCCAHVAGALNVNKTSAIAKLRRLHEYLQDISPPSEGTMFSPRPLPGSLPAPAPKVRRPSSETRGAGKHARQMQPAKSLRKRLLSSRILYTLCYLF